jgi:hypothetical protein
MLSIILNAKYVKRIKIDNSIIGPSPIIILAKIKYLGFSIFRQIG